MREKKQFFVTLCAFLLCILYAGILFAARTTLQGQVMQVKDGDTVVLAPSDGGAFFTCWLSGVSMPLRLQSEGSRDNHTARMPPGN